ncbi:hypothetical protein PsWM33_01114 [Pseudovibrio sp. WM33]|nr:hypothetical protein PsWM33_01114 [Pseudovibrio sp. WM33]
MPIYLDKHAELLKPRAGELWRPSNGVEGDLFEERLCACCTKSGPNGKSCSISLAAFFHDVDHPNYPKEWVISEKGQPSCTAHERCLLAV